MRVVLGCPPSARRRGLLSFLSLLVAALLAGCVDQAELPRADATAELPIFEGAQDYARVRLQLAAVDPCPAGAQALATFTAANEVFGLPVALAAGATLTVEAQGDPSLDTILGVYGPDDGSGFYGRLPIAVDDDSGEGWLSLLTTTVDEAGAYFVVVTTAGGLGRGPVTLVIGAAPCGDEGCTDDADCDDADECTVDRCDAATGQCAHTADPACGGGCTEDSACEDGNVCTIDLCDAATGTCTSLPQPDGAACDDGDPGTTGDVCQAGVCQGAVVTGCTEDAACDDGDACTVDHCDATTGACAHTPDPLCTSGCTEDSACDDGNVCTIDVCDAATGSCTSLPLADGAACDDGDPATTGDVCAAGVCRGTAVTDCDDGDDCTIDALDPATGVCVHTPDPICSSGCTQDAACDDANVCTIDECDAATGSCTHVSADGLACDDGDPTTVGDACLAGVCHGGGGPVCTDDAQCGDGDPCTRDFCRLDIGRCSLEVLPTGTPCDDGHPETIGDACVNGTCLGGCDDDDPCTVQGWDESTGACLLDPAPDGTPCDDGHSDTVGDVCVNGVCAGAGLECDDANACTVDSFDPATGVCVNLPAPDGAPCSDGDACTLADVCQAAVCVGAPRDCDDQDPCTEDRCDATTGVCWNEVICLDSRLEILAPVDRVHITAGIDPATGDRATGVAVTFRFRVTGALATDKIRLRMDDQPGFFVAATTTTYIWGVPCGSHLLSAQLTDAGGAPYRGSEDLVRFHVSCLCDSDLECAVDDPCRAWVCLGGTGGGDAFGSCRYAADPEDENCCLATADCRNVTPFTPTGADWQCVDVDGDQAGDCVECLADGECDDGNECTRDWCNPLGACVFSALPGCD